MKKIVVLFLMGLWVSPAWGITSGSVQNFHPATDNSPYLTTSGSSLLNPWQYHLGLSFDFSPKILTRRVGTVTQTMVDELLMSHLYGAIGLFPWLETGLDLPIALRADAVSLNRLSADNTNITRDKGLGLGDVRLETKLRLLDAEQFPLGIAFSPFFFLPTGDGNHFIGDNSFSGGARFVVDTTIAEKVQLALNAGYRIRKAFAFPGTTTRRDDEILLGFGVAIKAIPEVDVIGEISSSLLASDPFQRSTETPFEAGGALRFHLPWVEGLDLSLGVMAGLNNGYGAPSYRALGALSYTAPSEKKLRPAPPPPPPAVAEPIPEPPPQAADESIVTITATEIGIKKRVHFEKNRGEIQEVSYEILDAVAQTLKDYPQIKKIQIEGHTDSKGNEVYNLTLSQKRAEAVRQYLINKGVAPERLRAMGFGSSEPIDTNDTEIGRAKNRRVTFTILEKEVTPPTPPQPTPTQAPQPSPEVLDESSISP